MLVDAIRQWIEERGRVPSPQTIVRLSYAIGEPIGRGRAKTLHKQLSSERIGPIRIPRQIEVPRAELELKRWDDYPHIQAPALIVSDLHIPYHNAEWLETISTKALALGVRTLVVVGDLLDATHLAKWPSESSHTYEDELEIGQRVIQSLEAYFSIHLLMGNHDDRVSKKLDRNISAHALYKLAFPNIAVYRHHHAYIGNTWLVAHPGNYSRVPAQPAYQLAQKYERNVAIGHTHKFAIARDITGRRWVAEIGGCYRPELFSYIHRELRTNPAPQIGALIIMPDEKPLPLHPDGGW